MARAVKKPHIVSSKNETHPPKDTPPVLPFPKAFAVPFTAPEEHTVERMLHAFMGKMTGNISPASLLMAGMDWRIHLAFAPGKLFSLQKSLLQKTCRLSWYALYSGGDEPVPLPVQPAPGDYRFQGEKWQDWPFNLIHQGFLLYEGWWKEVTSGVRGASRHHLDVVSFTARQILDMFSPSNFIPTNPEVLDTTQKEMGANFWHGYQNFLDDLSRLAADLPPAGTEAFKVGENIAATPGKVVFRNALYELIQYAPATSEVYTEPVLIVPAWIMKYYILDLSPENSLVKYLVSKGHTVFIMSWVNPDSSARNWGMEDYVHQGLEEALNATHAITGRQVHTVGYCIGGTLLALTAAALARKDDQIIKTITLFAAQTDFEEAGELQLFIDDSQVAYLEDVMWQQGYLDKYQMAGAFQMLRSNDLIWSRLVNDYLQGKRQPINDLMAWNADATRMPYRMHSEYLKRLFLNNDLAEGRFMVDGEPVALKDIHAPIFTVGTVRDHVAPWKSVYKIHLLTESDITFVLTSGGHNAGIVSEPGHKGRNYQMAIAPHGSRYLPPEEWQKKTPAHEGSWWQPWQEWLVTHSSGKRKPPAMGNAAKGYAVLESAPGSYVKMK